eukprot:UN28003
MGSGNCFYTEELYHSGLLEKTNSKMTVFHNPGIVSDVTLKFTPPMGETKYVREYIEHLRNEKEVNVSVIGFSAGGLSAIKLTGQNYQF